MVRSRIPSYPCLSTRTLPPGARRESAFVRNVTFTVTLRGIAITNKYAATRRLEGGYPGRSGSMQS